ncbi:MAG: cation transporter [Erysipelotrichaceae bacterium]|jgi:cation diffusion facilitator family transporter|nr:cation transporter [Erysipelotrichaceae bacterium]
MKVNDLKAREKGIARTSLIGILGNVILVGIKATIGFIAGSISIIMDAVNNLTDALSSIITIIGTKLSGKKPDKKHPFGHGRIEYITSAVIGIIILIAGITAIYESILSIIDHFKNGTMADYSTISLIIIGIAILIKASLGIFFKIQGKKYESDALKASGTDALFDVLLSLGTLVGALVSRFANFYVEGYIGIVIGLFILRSGFEVIRGAVTYIIGSKFDEELANEIKLAISQVKGVHGVYDLILNNYGYNRYIGSVHVGVKDDLTAKEIQEIERAITYLMYTKYNTIMTTGIYAENTSSEIARKIKEDAIKIIQQYPNITQLHGFYIDETRNLINFDLVISFDEKDTDGLVKKVTDELNNKYEDYTFFVNVDRDY